MKRKAIANALLLILVMTIPLAALPSASAQSNLKTYAFIGAVPNPVGVGQETLLHIGITTALTNVNMGFDDLSVKITKPDGTTETISGIRTDSTGGTGRVYIPMIAGNYTLQTHFPEQVTTTSKMASGAPVGTKLLASDSEPLTLVVRQDPVPINPGVPLPDFFWTRPINAQFREWYSIAGSSWESNEYNDAPDSPHVLWTKPLTIGGLVGGELGLVGSGATSVAFENGDAYQGKWSSRIIIGGILIYTHDTNLRPLVYTAVDLRTGEELWEKTLLDNRTISQGQLFYWESYNYQGTFAYLWVTVGNDWYSFDPFTGEPRYSMTNMTSGTSIFGKRGELYRYSVSLTGGYMTLWNASALGSWSGSWNPSGGFGGSIYQKLNASATLANGTLTAAAQRAWAWNITIPKGLPGSVRAVRLEDRVVGSNLNNTDVNVWAFSLKPGQAGTLLFSKNWKAPADWATGNQSLSWAATDLDENIGLVWSKEERCHYAFSLENGEYLWKTESEHYLNIYSAGRRVYNGMLYSLGQAGTVYAYDLKTGDRLWRYDPNDVYHEVLWSNNWPEDILFAENGKIYCFHSEHSANQPLPRLAPAFCLNATTGEVIWRVDGLFRKTDWGGGPILGDSVIAMYNTYDQQVYAIGKGPSSVDVSVGPKTSAFGTSVVIEGTVTDVSPGTKQASVTLRFPKGVPAVSDESQGEWMKHVYAQFPRPMDVTGVKVKLSVLDSNGNYREIGTATADSDGFFKMKWTPDIEGEYTVYASFEGSASYYPSHAETAFAVDPAVEPVESPEYPQPVDNTILLYGILGGVVAAIVIGLVAVFLSLRKK